LTGIDAIVRERARWVLAKALRAEIDAHIARFADEGDGNGRRFVLHKDCHERSS
jgi:hypothetical protein